MSKWLNNTFYNKLPSDLKSVIIRTSPVVSGSGSGNDSQNMTNSNTTKNKIYLFPTREIGLVSSLDNKNNVLTDTRTLDYYDENNASVIKKDILGVASNWWLRTARSTN